MKRHYYHQSLQRKDHADRVDFVEVMESSYFDFDVLICVVSFVFFKLHFNDSTKCSYAITAISAYTKFIKGVTIINFVFLCVLVVYCINISCRFDYL